VKAGSTGGTTLFPCHGAQPGRAEPASGVWSRSGAGPPDHRSQPDDWRIDAGRARASASAGRRRLRSGRAALSQVNQSGCVKVLTNFYSTPLPVGTTVEAKVYSAYVEIWHGGHCVAQHERCYERHQQVLELDHYLDVIERKPGRWRIYGSGTVPYTRQMASHLRPLLVSGQRTK